MASPASTASQNVETNGGGTSTPGSAPSARAAGEIVAITTRDDFLLELSESLAGQASVRPVENMASALAYLAGSRRLTVLVIDTRDTPDVRGDVDHALAQAPTTTIVAFATAESEKHVAAAVKGSNVFAVLPIPLDRRKTAAIFEGALADASAKRAAAPRVDTKPEFSFEPELSPSVAGPDEPPTPQVGKAVWVAVGVAVIAVAAGGYWLFTKEEAAVPTTAGTSPSATASTASSATTAPDVADLPEAAVEVPLVLGKTDELLEKARLAMRERRYTEPANDSALLYYRSALAMDPDNGEAKDGMSRVASLLTTRFEESMQSGQYDDASGALQSLKQAAPGDARLPQLESRLVLAQINKAMSESNLDRANALLSRSASILPPDQSAKLRTEIAQRQQEARLSRLTGIVSDRIRDGRLTEPSNDSAQDYIRQLSEIPGTNALVLRLKRELNAALLRKAREASLANRGAEADRLVAEARANGASTAEIAAYQRDLVAARRQAAGAEVERLTGLARDRMRDGQLTEPANDSAMYYVTQLSGSESGSAAAATVGRELSAKLIERATASAREGRTALIDADLTAARRLGASPADIQAVRDIVTSRGTRAAAVQPRPVPAVTKLRRTRYQPPEYPQRAFQQKLTGSVTIEFVVDVNGEPRDVRVVDADPPEVFDRAAITAVKRWRYEPVVVNNVPTEVPTRMVIRFELPE